MMIPDTTVYDYLKKKVDIYKVCKLGELTLIIHTGEAHEHVKAMGHSVTFPALVVVGGNRVNVRGEKVEVLSHTLILPVSVQATLWSRFPFRPINDRGVKYEPFYSGTTSLFHFHLPMLRCWQEIIVR
jgi:hypothetical protein